MLKKILLIIGFIIICLVLYFFFVSPKDIKLTVVPRSYSNVSLKEENDNINIELYLNQKNSYITDKFKISSIYISDKEEDNQIKIDLLNLDYIGKCEIKESTYHRYNYKIKPIITNYDNLEIDNAYLIINYHNFKNIKVYIGSYSSYKVDDFNKSHLGITRLKGIVNLVNNKKTLVGMVLELNKETTKNIIIKDIKIFDTNVKVSDNSLIDIDKVSSSDDISKHLNYDYNINNIINKDIEFDLTSKDSFLISLNYQKHFSITDLGFQIYYEIDNEEFVYNYDKFHFFTDYENIVFIDELTFYTYEHD